MSTKVDGKVIVEVDALTEKFEKKLSGLQKTINAAGAALAGTMVALGASVVAVGKEFETSQKKASTLFGDVNVDVQNLNKNLIELSNQTGLAASDLSGALYSALSAGVEVTEDMAGATKYLESNSKLAIAGFTDVNTAVEATAKVLNAYKMDLKETDRVHGILIATQNKGITTVNEMSGVLAQVTPTAAAMNVSFEQVGASLALLTAQGTPTAQATTQLNALFAELGKSGTIGANSMKKALEGTDMAGKSFSELMTNGVQLNTVLDAMSKYASDSNLSMIDMFSSIESGKSALSIANASDTYNENMKTMMNTTGEVDTAYGKMMDTFENKGNMAIQKFKNLGITAYEKFEQPMKEALDSVNLGLDELATSSDFSEAVDGLANSFGGLVKTGVNLAKSVLPGMIKGLSWLLNNAAPIATGIVAMNVAIGTANVYQSLSNRLKKESATVTWKQVTAETALKAVKTPMFIGLVVGAVAAVTVGFIAWANSVETTTKKLKEERQEIDRNKKALVDRTKMSKEAFEQSLADISVLEKHADYIAKNTDETGKFIGNQDTLQVALKNLNDAFPDLNASYDENTGMILDQNGSVLELEASVRKLIEAKKVEAYLDTNKENYIQSVKAQIDAEKEQMTNLEQLFEIQQKRNKLDEEAYLHAVNVTKEYAKAEEMLANAGYDGFIDYGNAIANESILLSNIEQQKLLLTEFNDLIKSYEGMETLNQKGDVEGALKLMEGFEGLKVYDPNQGKEQLETLKTQVEDAQKSLDTLELSGKDAFDEETYARKLEQYKENLENAQAQYKTAQEIFNKDYLESEEIAANDRADQENKIVDAKNEEIAEKNISSAETATKLALSAVNSLIDRAIINPIVIPVIYQEKNSVQGLGRKGATFTAYDGNVSVFKAFSSDSLNIGQASVKKLYGRIGETLGSSGAKSNINNVENNNFTQTNVFNVPVNKPSQQTRAIEQASRNLLKVR